jgi:oligopeptidase A
MNHPSEPTQALNPKGHNALLDFSGLPRFDLFEVQQISSSIPALLKEAKAALQEIEHTQKVWSWDEVSLKLDVPVEKLTRSWGMVSHLNSVLDSPELRAAYNDMLPWVTEFWTQLGSSTALFSIFQSLNPQELNAEQAKALENALRDFELGGAKLKGKDKERYAQIQEKMAELSQKFSENVLDATDAWSHNATLEELDGVPPEVIQACREAAQAAQESGYRLSLKMPVYLPIMQFATKRALRQKLYTAYQTRACDQSANEFKKFDNGAVLHDILKLRHEEAQLLGFNNFAQLSLASKMAGSEDEVRDFLLQLANKAKPFALKDLRDMTEHAKLLGIDAPQAWDWTFIGERLKESRYAFSETEVKSYFPYPRVLEGLFQIVQTLFGVRIELDHASTWHPDVEFYRLQRDGQLIGQFYLDPFARNSKRAGAWMDDARGRWLRPDTHSLQTPVAYLVCNFAKGTEGAQALLTHDDVITLFHEFGHGLHHLLTQVNELDVSGINGVEWDAVELPSQFMENFCWQWSVVQSMSAHHQTGEPMPKALFDKMLEAKNFQSGLQMLRQIEFSLFDWMIHCQSTNVQDVSEILAQVRQEVSVVPVPAFCRPAHSFSHIFAGGYAAGYYSYKWAEVLSADAYAAIEEQLSAHNNFNPSMGESYRKNILEVGGSRSAMASFIAFRGREPSIDALLRHQGLN